MQRVYPKQVRDRDFQRTDQGLQTPRAGQAQHFHTPRRMLPRAAGRCFPVPDGQQAVGQS